MFCRVHSGAIHGIEGIRIEVEVDLSDGLPSLNMVGMLSAEIRESSERVRTALKNSDFKIPPKRITVNLSPANIRKQGTLYDLPIAVGILTGMGYVKAKNLDHILMIGELSLDGKVNPVKGVLPIVYAAWQSGIPYCIVPKKNIREGAVIDRIKVIGVSSLKEVLQVLENPEKFQVSEEEEKKIQVLKEISVKEKGNKKEDSLQEKVQIEPDRVDFAEVNGQQALKRAVQVAAAGMHNFLMVGPPGSGKTMIARRIPTILPPMTLEESIEITKIYSVAGLLSDKEPLVVKRPFRAPHHTISASSLVGGGRIPKPGEISLSNYGVLFLDELPEFSKTALEVLRQPMEDRKVMVSRVYGSYEFPTNFILVAAMNPCNCGYYPDRNRCNCKVTEVARYLGRISRPLLDRIDICMEVSHMEYADMKKGGSQIEQRNEDSATMRERVVQARKVQQRRYQKEGINTNSELSASQIQRYCKIDRKGEALLEQAFTYLRLTARGYNRILKVARTIADLDGEEQILGRHLSEAICYRSINISEWRE